MTHVCYRLHLCKYSERVDTVIDLDFYIVIDFLNVHILIS